MLTFRAKVTKMFEAFFFYVKGMSIAIMLCKLYNIYHLVFILRIIMKCQYSNTV